jgi:bacterioferritin
MLRSRVRKSKFKPPAVEIVANESSPSTPGALARDTDRTLGCTDPQPREENTMAKKSAKKPFLTDIKTLRKRAREHIMHGAITPGYRAQRETVVKLLNEALATEIVCVLRYKRHYFMASGINADSVAQEFLAHANEEQAHADEIAARIVQLNGEPNLNPEGLTSRSHAEYVEGSDLVDMIRENLVAERIAIDSYREMINYIGNKDTTTKRMLEGILAMEEEHADDLVGLLEKMDK